MLEQYQNKKTPEVGPKILVASLVGILLSVGLCGVGAATMNTKVSPFFVWLGVIVLGLSIVGILVGVVWLVVEGFQSRGK